MTDRPTASGGRGAATVRVRAPKPERQTGSLEKGIPQVTSPQPRSHAERVRRNPGSSEGCSLSQCHLASSRPR